MSKSKDSNLQMGTVKRFNKIKGYGFITPDTGDEEVFVHFSEIQTPGYKELIVGQRIRYTLAEGEKGNFAKDVTLIDSLK